MRNLLLAFFCLISALARNRAGAAPGSLRLEREIPLPGVEGRIDHLTADVAGQRVFVAALGNGTLEIVDLAQGKRSGEIKGLKDPAGSGVCAVQRRRLRGRRRRRHGSQFRQPHP